MEEMTRENFVERKIRKNKNWEGSFDPLQRIPINQTEWFKHIQEKIQSSVDMEEFEEEEIIAKAKIDRVSYTNKETGECDIRWEARYEIV